MTEFRTCFVAPIVASGRSYAIARLTVICQLIETGLVLQVAPAYSVTEIARRAPAGAAALEVGLDLLCRNHRQRRAA